MKLSDIFGSKKKSESTPFTASTNAAATTAAVTGAPGSCGQVKLFDVPDRTAAMLMAVVADEIKTPLNELRFISIRETSK